MAFKVELRPARPQPVLSIRVKTRPERIAATLAEILPEVFGYLKELGVPSAGRPFTRYHHFSAEEVDLEGGLPVSKPVAGRGRIAAGELPGGLLAASWHVGPYDGLAAAHQALRVWLDGQGRQAAGPSWEVYWTDPAEVPNPAEWKTEVICPVA